jgi:hypothetical protein
MGRIKIKIPSDIEDISPLDSQYVAVVVMPKEPFLNWVRNLPDPDHVVTLERLRKEPNIYLLPSLSMADSEAAWAWIEEGFDWLFVEQLEGWWRDEKAYPENRTYEMLLEWFEIHVSTMVQDMTPDLVEFMKEKLSE